MSMISKLGIKLTMWVRSKVIRLVSNWCTSEEVDTICKFLACKLIDCRFFSVAVAALKFKLHFIKIFYFLIASKFTVNKL